MQLKLQFNTIIYLLQITTKQQQKTLTISSVGEEAEQLKLPYIAGENAKW